MIRIELDSRGPFVVRWPSSDDKTIRLATSFVTHEADLPSDQQYPLLPLIRSTLETASAGASSAGSGETSRAVSAEELRNARSSAKKPLKQAFDALKVQSGENLAVLEEYGLHTKQGDGGVTVYAPRTPQAWDSFLVKYVEQQGALEAEAQIRKPALETLAPLADTVRASRESRDGGRTQREIGVGSRVRAAAQLHDLLEVAACHLVVSRFGFEVTRDLKLWGYEVVQATAATEANPAGENSVPAGG